MPWDGLSQVAQLLAASSGRPEIVSQNAHISAGSTAKVQADQDVAGG